MDAFDKKILSALHNNARQSVSAIAEQVSLSRSAVSERIRRMEENGDILGYRVLCKSEATPSVKAYFEIRHGGYHCESIAEAALKIDGIKLCHGISGDLDLLLFAEAESMIQLHQIRSELDIIPNVGKVTTHIVMNEWRS